MEIVIVGVAAILSSALAVPLVKRWAERSRLIDFPNARSSHTRPTPRGGGLVIVVLTLMIWTWMAYTKEAWPARTWLALTLSALLVAGVSFMDDIRSLSSATRLLAQTAAAAFAVALLGNHLTNGAGAFPFVIGFAWIVWIAGVTNAFNFMDGIDGIAGAQAVIAAVGWVIIALRFGSAAGIWLSILLASTSLGFLVHNWPPAKIFMGDVGSAFLGFCFAVMPMLLDPGSRRLLVAAALLIWPFLFDTAFTLVRRARNRENIFAAHRSHLYQRLVMAGQTHRQVTVLFAMLAVIGVIGAVALTENLPYAGTIVAVVTSACAAGLWLYVRSVEQLQESADF